MPEQQYPYVVYYDPSIGKFRLNPDIAIGMGSSAYRSSRSRDRVNYFKALYQQRKATQLETALDKMSKGKLPGYEVVDGEYMIPSTGDPEKDLKRIEADYLNFQILGQAEAAKQMAEAQEPGGWKGVLHDALDNPVGGAVMRGLDVVSRPAYAIAEGYDRLLSSVKGEHPEHPGWHPAPFQESYGILGNKEKPKDLKGGPGWWRNRKTGEYQYHPEWEEPEGVGEAILGGAREGITGREKTSWSEVLRKHDILEGKPAAVVGFGLDVLADPTTYVSFGTVSTARTAAKESAEAAARVSAREMVQSGLVKGPLANRRAYSKALAQELERVGLSKRNPASIIDDIDSSYGAHSVERAFKDRVEAALKDPFWKKGSQRSIANQARRLYDAERKVLGEPIDAAVRKQVGIDAVKSARDEFTSKVGADVMDEIATRKALRENLRLDVKFAGRRVASSKVGGRLIQKTSAAARATRPGQILARTFRTDAEIGNALHRIQRQFSNVSAAQFEEEAKSVKRIFTELGLSKGQRQKISRALETGDTKGFTDEMISGYDRAREFFRSAFDREVEAGALAATDFKDNYLYHVYKEPNFRRGIGSWVKPTGRGATKFRTLDEAIAAGARPLTDVADILVHRLAKSHRVASSHLMMRAIAARFGVEITGKTIANKALKALENQGIMIEGRKIAGAGKFFEKGVFFDQDVASSIAKMNQFFSNDELITRFGKLFDQAQARMKFLQTAPNPGFHIRNTMSDMFVNFLDGVTTVKPYTWAAKLLSGRGDNIVLTLKNGEKLTGEEILQLYDGMGLRAGFFHAEAGIVPGMGRKVLTGSSNIVRRFSEIREDTMRMAHFVDALEKTPASAGRAEEIAELAAKRVRKYNFDYQDLTTIEKRVFRRAVPFYTFMRKNVPLMLESYFTKPGRMIVPTKAQNALAQFMGQDNRDEPLPGMINTTPQWISSTPGVELAPQTAGGEQVFMQPDMPYNQIESLFGGFAQGNTPLESLKMGGQQFLKEILLEQSTPLVRTAAEYATQTDLATGAEQPQSLADAFINQFPVGRIAQRPLSRALPGIFLESDRPGSPTYTVSIAGQKVEIGENVANYITGMGFRKVTPERMKSELRRRQDILEALIRRLKEDAVEQEQKNWDEQYGDLYGTG